jgi:TolB-like protein
LHDDLITELSRTSGLTVISRSSVMRFQEREQSVGEIARALGVAALVEGGVQSGQGRIRVNAKLIDPRDDTHIWANRYDRTLTADGLFDIQVELAREIARAAHTEISPTGRDPGQQAPTESLEAYRLCAQGRALLDRRTERGMRAAAALFREAALEDRSYTLAWVGLADSLTLLFDYGYEGADAVLLEAEEALETAMELEPGSAEAQASLGLLYANRRNGPDAIRALHRAVELRPGYAEAHNWLSWVNQIMDHAPEALAHARQAVTLDPLSPEAISNLALSQLENGQAGAALREARCARDLQPDWDTAAFYEGLALYHLERFAEARRVLEGLVVPWAGSGPKVTLALSHLALHEGSRAREMLAEFSRQEDRFAVGLLRAALGEQDGAFESLMEETDWDYWPVFAVHHFYPRVLGPLRGDPRFGRVREKAKRSWGG